jgi:hypothetical protein
MAVSFRRRTSAENRLGSILKKRVKTIPMTTNEKLKRNAA